MQRAFLIRLLLNSNTPIHFGLRSHTMAKGDIKIQASQIPQSFDSVFNEVRPTGKFSLKNTTTAWAGTRAPTLCRRYTHPITKIDPRNQMSSDDNFLISLLLTTKDTV